MPGESDDDDTLWVDSADRKTAIRALAEHRAEDNLTEAEHDQRLELARQAQTRGDLKALFTDLPAPHPLIDDDNTGGVAWVANLARVGNGAGLLVITGSVVALAAVLAGWWIPALLFGCLLVVAIVFASVSWR
jgi:hypothetical protein